MVKLVVLHQAGLAPVYGGKLSKYLHNQAMRSAREGLYPLLHTLNFFGLQPQKFSPKPFLDCGGKAAA